MYGRGYVNNGSAIAADYIAAQMQELNLTPFGGGYKQDFTVHVKTYPSAVSLKVNGQNLDPAIDFTVVAGSPSIKGIYKILKIDSSYFKSKHKHNNLLKKDLNNTFIAFNPKEMKGPFKRMADSLIAENYIQCRGFIHLSERNKMNWSVYAAEEVLPFPILTMASSALKGKKGKMEVNIELEVKDDYQVSNIIAYLPGTTKADSFLVLTAHYDHLGMLGNKIYPGANDNASGVAMMLDLAREYSILGNKSGYSSKQHKPDNLSHLPEDVSPKSVDQELHDNHDISFRSDYSIVFMAFAGEEIGLRGSKYQVENPYIPLDKIKCLINMDMVGTGSEGITMVNAEQLPHYFAMMDSLNSQKNYVAKVAKRGESCNSDHCPFYKKGVPSIFIYSMGQEHLEYHTVNDTSNRLPLTEYNDIFSLLRDFLNIL